MGQVVHALRGSGAIGDAAPNLCDDGYDGHSSSERRHVCQSGISKGKPCNRIHLRVTCALCLEVLRTIIKRPGRFCPRCGKKAKDADWNRRTFRLCFPCRNGGRTIAQTLGLREEDMNRERWCGRYSSEFALKFPREKEKEQRTRVARSDDPLEAEMELDVSLRDALSGAPPLVIVERDLPFVDHATAFYDHCDTWSEELEYELMRHRVVFKKLWKLVETQTMDAEAAPQRWDLPSPVPTIANFP